MLHNRISTVHADSGRRIWMACVNGQATIFAPFVFRLLLNRYVASEGLGEVGSMLGFFDLFCLIPECQ